MYIEYVHTSRNVFGIGFLDIIHDYILHFDIFRLFPDQWILKNFPYLLRKGQIYFLSATARPSATFVWYNESKTVNNKYHHFCSLYLGINFNKQLNWHE